MGCVVEKDKTKNEFYPDAWARFERAVDVVAKSPPQHRVNLSKPKPKVSQKKQTKKPGR
jgi:hypothetical protein